MLFSLSDFRHVDFHMKWPDGIEQFSTKYLWTYIFYTIQKRTIDIMKYITKKRIDFDFHSSIEERRGKNPYVSTTNHHVSNRSKTSSEGTLFSVSRTLSAPKLTRWPLTRYRFIRFSLAYRERSQLQVDTRWLARF